MKLIETLLFCSFLFLHTEIYPQTGAGEISLVFYNVENLFDTADDPVFEDQEFTPRGDRRWTTKRLNRKVLGISKVLMNAAGWEPPQIIMLCEVENRYVLELLIKKTPLKAYPLNIIHKESPDIRGTDVAFLYNEKNFYPLNYRYFPLKTPEDSVMSTREILYVFGIVNGTDTLHIFANHWPSRYGGLLESQPLRRLAAQTLRNQVDALQEKYTNPKIIITGDFNDQPSDESISGILQALKNPFPQDTKPALLYNLSAIWEGKEPGTIKYRSQWSVFDQFIVSGSLLDSGDKLFTRDGWARIVSLPFLFTKDEKYGGQKLVRTYAGFRYSGGTSDHLPVLLKLEVSPGNF